MDEIRGPDAKQLAHKDYLMGMKYKDIAEKYGVSLNTVKSWKQRYNWERKKGAHKEKVCTPKRGAPKGNKNALGNAGGAPPGNKNAETHGLFSKYLPAETMELIKSIETWSPLDLLWDQIMIQYAAIIRSQQIMYVKDRKDKTITKIEEKDGNVWGEKWEVQQAWDKQANFLKAQSRAMGELRSMIKQYDELLHKNWELATEEQKARIAMLKSKVDDKGDGVLKIQIVDDIPAGEGP